MFSLGTIKTVDAPGLPSGVARTFEFDSTMRYALLYHLFGLFWATQFIQAVTELTIAFVATHWFFSARVDGRKQLRPHTTLFAFNTVLRYHLGTAAFGSAIIAIIKTIRALIEYVQARVKKANRGSTFIRAVLCLCRCCFWCLDCCMRFINRNAYAVVALTKQGFCGSASTAFGYIARNLARVGALAGVSTAYLFLGKLFVAGISTAIGYIVFTQVSTYSDPNSDSAVASPFWPCMIIFLVSYNIGALFMSVYAVTIDAMLMCYVYNEDKHIIDDETGTAIERINKEAKAAGEESAYEDEEVGETVIASPTGPGAKDSRPTYA
jgi:choline transporter-like protein 2/4/5